MTRPLRSSPMVTALIKSIVTGCPLSHWMTRGSGSIPTEFRPVCSYREDSRSQIHGTSGGRVAAEFDIQSLQWSKELLDDFHRRRFGWRRQGGLEGL